MHFLNDTAVFTVSTKFGRGGQSAALQLVFAAPETLCHLKETMQKSN